nr:hypothetical protein [Candidatus Gracilibacteria bacterium]
KAPTTAPTIPQQTPSAKAPTTAPTIPQQTPSVKAPTTAPTIPQQTPSAKAPTTAPTIPQQTPSAKAPTTAPTIPQQTPSAKAPTIVSNIEKIVIENEQEKSKKLIDWVTMFKAVTRYNSDEFIEQVFDMNGHSHFGYEGRSGTEGNSIDKEILKRKEVVMYLDNGKYALRFYIEGSVIKYQAYERKTYSDEFIFGNNLEREYRIYKNSRDDFSFKNGKIDIDNLLKKDN